jgi:septal ring factor EnvC (AmiA/AmiB activator)
MTIQTTVLGLGLVAVFSLSARGSAQTQAKEPRPPARVYTNEDLDRVHPLRNETGVASVPSASPEGAAPEPRPPSRGRGEEYWRREAARVRDRVRTLEGQAATLRAQIAESEAQQAHLARRGTASAASSKTRLEVRLAGLERRILQLEDDLAERARRERALPGWLR